MQPRHNAPGAPPTGDVSQPQFRDVHVEHGLLVPTRDGEHLSLDLIRPSAAGAFPVVLERTPYDKTRGQSNAFYRSLAERGYIVAVQDARGRFNSSGRFVPYMDEKQDGYDTVEWIAAQDWCDGNIGMAGGSYAGQMQWLAAALAPPHLKAIVPFCSPPDLFSNEPIFNGVFLLAMAEWMVKMGVRAFQTDDFIGDIFKHDQPYYDALPVADLPRAAHVSMPWWDEFMQHPNWDDFWRQGSYQDAWNRMTMPALNVTGWYDMNFPGAPTNFAGMRERAATPRARHGQKLVIGPWPHWVNRTRTLNGLDFGHDAVIDLDTYVMRFYDRWLKGVANGLENEKPVYVFVMGANEWWEADDWPLPGTEYVPFYLHSHGRANTLLGDGMLARAAPAAEPSDTYRYDPRDPVKAIWDLRDGPVDDRVPSTRHDVLCYTGEVVTEPFDVVGPVSCCLYAASSALDTDWHVRLVDVHPDGYAQFLCHGALRARFWESFETPHLLEPHKVYGFRFGLDATGNRFLAGHRLRLEITSSWFPRFDRNTNSGAPNNFLDAEVVVAEQTIFHDASRPSHVLLPIAPRKPASS